MRATSPATDVILITAYGAVADAVTALKEGAYDYVLKPFDIEVIELRLERIAERRRLAEEFVSARAAAARLPESPNIGRTPAMVRLTERIGTVRSSKWGSLALAAIVSAR